MSLFAAATAAGQASAPSMSIQFERERVVITAAVDGGSETEVDGTYWISRPTPAVEAVQLAYPFPPSEQAPVVVQLEGAEVLHAGAEGLELGVRFNPGEPEHRFRVRYRQALGVRRVSYLVTTARLWPSPIHRADFGVRAPSRWGEPRWGAWPPAEPTCTAGTCEWSWSFAPFLPGGDLDLRW